MTSRLSYATVFLVLSSLGRFALANPLDGSLEIGTSVSQSYGSRTTVSNPAGLGFDTSLNGAELGTSFSYGANRDGKDDYSFGLSYAYVGLSAERLESMVEPTTRYRAALGVPITSSIFGGVRYSWWRGDAGTRFDDVAVGAQWRPFTSFSLGVTGSQLNRPQVAGTHRESLWTLGATWRPIERFELSMDGATPGGARFFDDWSYQAAGAIEIWRGITVRGGYHSRYKAFAGLQIGLGNILAHTSAQPDSSARKWVSGFQTSLTPYRTALPVASTLKVRVDSRLTEDAIPSSIFGPGRPSLWSVLETLHTAEDKPYVETVIVDLESMPLGLASAQEIHDALVRLRQQGKRVEVYLGSAGLKEYLIASAATSIYLGSGGELRILGLRSQRYFLKGTLDKLGVEGEFIAKGEYKSAPETFTRTESSPVNREATMEELKVAEGVLLQTLQKSRGITEQRWAQLQKMALISPQVAMREKLIDGIRTFDAELGRQKLTSMMREDVRERSNRLSLPPRISIVVADGNILNERVRLMGVGGGEQITPDSMQKKLDAAVKDARTEAILLRVNSGGGEILASDRIAELVRAAQQKKPVVVSFGDIAASGGYYIGAPGDKVFASPLTLTGSIGVFVGKFSAKGLFQYLRLNKEILTRAPYPGLRSEDRPWSKEERDIYARRVDEYYDSFISFVAASRKMPKEQVDAAAKGRVWLGVQAAGFGLVDSLGGYREALGGAAYEAGLELEDCEVSVVREPMALADWVGENAFGSVRSEIPLVDSRAVRDFAVWSEMLQRQPVLYVSPSVPLE